MTEPDTSATARDPDRLVFGGLIALAQTTVFQLVARPLSPALEWSIGLFAVAIPLLAACLLAAIARGRHAPPRPPTRLAGLVGLAAALTAVAGFGAFFLHFGWLYLAAFGGTALAAVPLIRRM